MEGEDEEKPFAQGLKPCPFKAGVQFAFFRNLFKSCPFKTAVQLRVFRSLPEV